MASEDVVRSELWKEADIWPESAHVRGLSAEEGREVK